ncbi:phosphopantetheine binding protein [Micromonospora pisi]|uniref:Phosphopantetheine binding protein n=1 Tax=Micromonospora pisi TaxID=589240 RepID=A0A495JCQ0_9ACTN|nr:acyl carrier protein [Micromonospora pisi]RKR86144.1 phosphopantetheine binding protein [Micromonospora pisi]
MNADDDLRRRLADLVHEVTDGAVTADDALDATASLVALGVDSLGLLRLIDAIETEYDVELDLSAGGHSLTTVDDLAAQLTAHLPATP